MRLPSYESGTRLDQRVFLKVTGLVGADVDDVGKSALRRPDFFGRPFIRAPGPARSIGVVDRRARAVNTINRVADALGFQHRSETSRRRGAAILRRGGYRLPGFLMR